MSYFREALQNSDHRALTKWAHYFDVYQRELGMYQGRDIRFLEIGIFQGGSIPMWTGFFGKDSHMVFVDIDESCRAYAEPSSHIEIGDQADPEFLTRLVETHGPFDVIIDDGGHRMHQQITSFEYLWPALSDRGVYLVEDTHTSYWPGFGGGYREERSFIEYAKRLVDKMHSWYTDQDEIFPFDEIAREMRGVRFYDSVVVIDKDAKKDAPLMIGVKNGKIEGSRRALKVRNRGSIFKGQDGKEG